MNTAPRPNVRRLHPLDAHERDMISMPVTLPPPDGISRGAWLWVLGSGVVMAALGYWVFLS
jgi:hypothetical protein